MMQCNRQIVGSAKASWTASEAAAMEKYEEVLGPCHCELFPGDYEPQPGENVAQEPWGFGGFANTDLDLQLKKHGIHQLIRSTV
jgi:nicotinamidase-related amidase